MVQLEVQKDFIPTPSSCWRGSILTVCVASPLRIDMATFTLFVGMPLRPQLSTACTTLLQDSICYILGGTWEHPALTVTFRHLCVQCASPVPWGTPGREVCTWRPIHSSCAGMPFPLQYLFACFWELQNISGECIHSYGASIMRRWLQRCMQG